MIYIVFKSALQMFHGFQNICSIRSARENMTSSSHPFNSSVKDREQDLPLAQYLPGHPVIKKKQENNSCQQIVLLYMRHSKRRASGRSASVTDSLKSLYCAGKEATQRSSVPQTSSGCRLRKWFDRPQLDSCDGGWGWDEQQWERTGHMGKVSPRRAFSADDIESFFR